MTSATVEFTIAFFGPFRVASGGSRPGVDAAIVTDDWLPSSSLKGLMRAAAVELGVADELRDEVFGTARAASPWSWSHVEFDASATTSVRTRIKISHDTGTVAHGALLVGDEAWASTARFSIDAIGRLDEGTLVTHQRVLVLTAAAVRSLGASRNRGYGWVAISSPAQPVDASMVELIGGASAATSGGSHEQQGVSS